MKINRIIISLLLILLSSSLLLSETDEDKIRDLFDRFEKGWETKNIELIKACFTRLPSKQISMYKYIFSISGKVILDVEIKDIVINGSFANIKARLKKEISYTPVGVPSQKEVRDKELRYILGKKNGNWYILGTIDPSLAKLFKSSGKVRITDKNYKAINKLMEQIPLKDRKSMYSNFGGPRRINEEERKIKWASMGTIVRYKATITTEKLNNNGEGGGTLIWKSEMTFNLEMDIPKDIIKKLEISKIYYLNIYGYDSKEQIMGIGLRQIRRDK